MRPSFFRQTVFAMKSRTHNPLPFLLAAICLASGLFAAMSSRADDTGVRGTVLWGPVSPGPTRVGHSDEAPFSATFIVLAAEREVARFRSDKNGHFEVALPAGDYVIIPDNSTPIPAPQSQAKSVNVPEDSFAEVTLRFDTGMR